MNATAVHAAPSTHRLSPPAWPAWRRGARRGAAALGDQPPLELLHFHELPLNLHEESIRPADGAEPGECIEDRAVCRIFLALVLLVDGVEVGLQRLLALDAAVV